MVGVRFSPFVGCRPAIAAVLIALLCCCRPVDVSLLRPQFVYRLYRNVVIVLAGLKTCVAFTAYEDRLRLPSTVACCCRRWKGLVGKLRHLNQDTAGSGTAQPEGTLAVPTCVFLTPRKTYCTVISFVPMVDVAGETAGGTAARSSERISRSTAGRSSSTRSTPLRTGDERGRTSPWPGGKAGCRAGAGVGSAGGQGGISCRS